jgi:hypothetical protein
MALASPKLALPNAAEQLAFRCVDQILRSDPVLSGLKVSFRSWTGAPEDILDPTFATCPYLRISPKSGQSKWATEQQHQVDLVIGIQVAVAGSDADQLFNFWGAVRTALFPRTAARLVTVQGMALTAQISKSIMTANGYGFSVTEQGLRMLIAAGTVQLVLLVQTP